ncbi:MAG: hypothetical protein JWO06_586 [Bacteroidota bacterium]|nr:hypothetical protein [Bacteroidota bacterium]
MVLTLLSHQWKEFWRSRNAGRNLAIQILMGFLLLYLLISAIALGAFLPTLLGKMFPAVDVITSFCGLVLYYFAFDIIIRFMLQDLPTLSVQPYLVQNIKHKQLVGFLNLRSLFSFFNLLPFILILPFIFMEIGPHYGIVVALSFALTIFSLCVFNHFAILFIKRKTIISTVWLAGVFVAVLLIIGLDYFNIFSMRRVSEVLFTFLLVNPWLCLVIAVLAFASFYNNQRFLLRNLYVEEMVKSSGHKTSADYVWLNQFGTIGDMIALELKLIIRNKRPRNVFLSSSVLLFYGFFLYKQVYLDRGSWGFILMGGILITGMFIASYGQLLFAWQSPQFDGLMASNIDLRTYVKSKFLLLASFSTVAFLLSLLYGFKNWKIVPVEVAAYFFNIGINSVLCIYFATKHYKAVDLSKNGSFNNQGASASRYWYSLFLALTAMGIYLPFAFLINNWAGIIAIGTLGLTSFLLREWWIDILTRELFKNKYQILDGFREK